MTNKNLDCVEKDFQPSLNKVIGLMKQDDYTINAVNHYLDGNILRLSKSGKEYAFSFTSQTPSGKQTHEEIKFQAENIVELTSSEASLYVLGKAIFIDQIDFGFDRSEKKVTGSISGFCTVKNQEVFDKCYLRYIVPIGEKNKVFNIRHFEKSKQGCITPQGLLATHIDYVVSSSDFHLYTARENNEYFLIIDCIEQIDLPSFEEKCFSTLLALGLISGNLALDESFILSFSEERMSAPTGLIYQPKPSSIYTKQAAFTTNISSISYGKGLSKEEKDKLAVGLEEFPKDVFSSLATQLHKHEKLRRATMLLLLGKIASLEMRLPAYYIAIEAITAHAVKVKDMFGLIKDESVAKKVLDSIKKLVEAEGRLHNADDFNSKVLLKKITHLNRPTNEQKLSQLFKSVGYPLSEEEHKILRSRNVFLHGGFTRGEDDKRYRDTLHTSLRLSFLVTVLLLKLAGFEGKIINYAELWSGTTKKKLNEDLLRSI